MLPQDILTIPHNPLQPLHDLDSTSPQFHEHLIDFIRGKEYRDAVPGLKTEDLAWLVEYLDNIACGISNPGSVPFQESPQELRKICGLREVLPKSCTLSESLPGCVFEGTLSGSRVRIRRVRVYPKGDPQKVKETFHQIAVVWKHLAHSNIVPFLGITIDPLQFISDWMPGGDLTEYITNNPEAERLRLLSDVAEGLNYLHSCNVVHGDLKGSNILMDAAGRARITEFGLAVVFQNLDSIRNASDEYGHGVRWIAPEILDGRGTYSKEADVFSFAMLTIEVFTDPVPFRYKPPHAATLAIIAGERPPRPTHPALTDRLWALTERCWDQEADLRQQVLRIACSFGIPAWKRLIDRPLAEDQRISLITDLFSDRDETEAVKQLCGDDAQSFVDVIDKSLDSLPPRLRGNCLAVLCRICGRQALLPSSVQIPLCYNRLDTPLYRGGFAEVWKGEHEGREVAVKVLKVYVTSNLVKITKRFCKEVVVWKALRHQNILPLLGVTMSKNQFTMVSEWMINGNINEFIKVHRDANRFDLLKGIARGLIYLHGQAMIHGDLKGANILIDRDFRARLADFGLLTIVSDFTNPTSSAANAGTIKWMSPELLDPERFGFENSRPTNESDCYALGMVILEVLTSRAPFANYKDFIVIRKVVEGERPRRPQGSEAVWFTDDLWGTLEQCWSSQPKLRPTVDAVLECLEQESTAWLPLPPSEDKENQTDSDDDSVSIHFPLGQPIPQNSDRSPVFRRTYIGSRGLSSLAREHIGIRLQSCMKLPSGTCIPQRHYCRGVTMQGGAAGQTIMFATLDGGSFPASLALAGQYDLLVDGGGSVFAEKNHTITLRVEWPGYDGWGTQIRTVDYRENPKSITRAKLVKEIARQLTRFIEKMGTTPIDPGYVEYKVGLGGIELRDIHIASLEQVSRASWQPRLIYSGP